MNEDSIVQYITETFNNVHIEVADGNTFFFYDPDRKFPFATLVTNDTYDQFSNLNRSDVFRLNIGVRKQTFRELFDSQILASGTDNVSDSSYDFTVLDKLMPHPIYGKMYWVCVLNPNDITFQTVQKLLAEAYSMSVEKCAKRNAS